MCFHYSLKGIIPNELYYSFPATLLFHMLWSLDPQLWFSFNCNTSVKTNTNHPSHLGINCYSVRWSGSLCIRANQFLPSVAQALLRIITPTNLCMWLQGNMSGQFRWPRHSTLPLKRVHKLSSLDINILSFNIIQYMPLLIINWDQLVPIWVMKLEAQSLTVNNPEAQFLTI